MLFSAEPTNVVLYTLAESGYVGFYDPTATVNGDLYFVARSLRPVAVAYDPIQKVIFIVYCQHRSLLTNSSNIWFCQTRKIIVCLSCTNSRLSKVVIDTSRYA